MLTIFIGVFNLICLVVNRSVEWVLKHILYLQSRRNYLFLSILPHLESEYHGYLP